MFSELIESVIRKNNIPVINEDNIEDFISSNKDVVLFFAGDANRLVEVNDLAVILPELLTYFNGSLAPAIIDRSSERKLQIKYHFNAYPSLVFLRDGGYLGVISRVHNWGEYVEKITEILNREVSEIPPYELPGHLGSDNADKVAN